MRPPFGFAVKEGIDMRLKRAIRDLKPYAPNETDYLVKLDANESANYLFPEGYQFPVGAINRYPDSASRDLRHKMASVYGVDAEQLIVGNGSSEMLELILKTYVEPGDVILSLEPSFVMYQVYGTIHNAQFKSVPLNADFSVNGEALLAAIETHEPTVIVLCSPNNPTGLMIDQSCIDAVLSATEAIVILDEAYIEFARSVVSRAHDTRHIPHLIVLRTMSKAYGLAGARVGCLIAHPDRVSEMNRVKSPYNLNTLSQNIARLALSQTEAFESYIEGVKARRDALLARLSKWPLTVWTSEANFVFFHSAVLDLSEQLAAHGVLIRSFGGGLKGYYRVTVGSEGELDRFYEAMKEVFGDAASTR